MIRWKCFLLLVVGAASAAGAREVEVDLKYPVPAMPVEGWSTASINFRKRIPTDIELHVASAENVRWLSTAATWSEKLKDNYPHKSFVNLHLLNYREETSPLGFRIGDNPSTRRPSGIRFGRSVVGLTSARNTVKALVGGLDLSIEKARGNWEWGGSLPTGVEIAEHANAKLLPDSWMGYDLLQAMVIEDFPYSDLSRAQEDAIVQWVERGGTILVSPGKSGMVFRSSLLRRLVDFTERGPQTVRTTSARLYRLAAEKVAQWDVTVTGATSKTLAEVAPCGAGTVVVFRYDILRPPFSGWSELGRLLRDTSFIPMRKKSDRRFSLRWPSREDKLPRVSAIALMLGGYLLILGPANYLLLRRKKRLVLMPFTIGGVAVAFTVAILVYGYVSRGIATELREFTLIRTYPDRTTAFAVSQKGIYASGNREFGISFGDNTALRNLTRRMDRWGSKETPLMVRDSGQGTLEARFTSLMWEVFSFEAQAALPGFGNLRVEKRDGAVTVFNATDADLENCWVKDSGRWYEVGKLAKLATATNPHLSSRPPKAVMRQMPTRKYRVGPEVIVVGKAARGAEPAIPYTFIKGRARTVESNTYILGGAR